MKKQLRQVKQSRRPSRPHSYALCSSTRRTFSSGICLQRLARCLPSMKYTKFTSKTAARSLFPSVRRVPPATTLDSSINRSRPAVRAVPHHHHHCCCCCCCCTLFNSFSTRVYSSFIIPLPHSPLLYMHARGRE